MKQRLGIAQALLARPKLLICDEPTSALDPIGRKEILDILYSVREQTTVLFSTHILSDVERICTEVALLNDGKIAMLGTVDELKKITAAEQFTIELMDNSRVSLLLESFPCATLDKNGAVIFKGTEAQMFEALDLIRQNGLPLRKVERFGATLESVFMEVVGK
jgi:ABC-2 type transport system ATP-binding protein